MPRYIVERTFPDGLEIPATDQGAKTCLGVIQNNAEEQVTWVTSYVSTDKTKTYCVYDAPSEELVRKHAEELGAHDVEAVYEIAGDVTPDDFPLD